MARRRTFPTRAVIQLAFVVLVVGGVFVLGGNAERWCPFGGAEAIYIYVSEGNLPCSLQVSNLFMLGGVLLSVLLLRRAFCGYACPIGAISEWTHRLGRALGLKSRGVPRVLDRVLSGLKYAVLVVLLVLTWRTGELIFRGYDPCYALLSRHGEDITYWAYVVSGAILLASFIWSVPFCRWLCPLGALLNPFSRFAWWRVKRVQTDCSGCGMCSNVCPMRIPVHEVEEVRHARCTACMECVSACPRRLRGALEVRTRAPRAFVVGGLILLLAAPVAASWLLPLPSFRWSRGEAPETVATIEAEIDGLTCRGSANLLVYFLTRDDELELPGYLALEAWPGPDTARARITFDPGLVDEDAVRSAITEPYFEPEWQDWRHAPFRIEGYDPFTER
ncbi:MAG: 4Fe-4S binding protein [Planctomycetota bacterium]|nr:4Fe-4S binding protein [Planctomycetota bacterium]